MRLYHGTNCDIEFIDLQLGLRFKDFGQGFYLTPSFDTARRMAIKRFKLFGGNACVLEYEYDTGLAQCIGLRTLAFPEKATKEWASFIDCNRKRTQPAFDHGYDIVSGPIANDGVAYLLGRYHEGTQTLEELALALQDRYLDQQYYFGTEQSLKCLTKIQVFQL